MSAEVIQFDESWARRITERIRYSAIGVHDGIEKLRALMDEAQRGAAHTLLGYASWTAYIADVMGEEPLRLARDERRDLVAWLSGQGMSTRAIASVTGSSKNTITSDLREVSQIGTPDVKPPAHRRTYSDEQNVRYIVDDSDEADGFDEQVDYFEGIAVNAATGEVIEPTVTEHTVTEKVKTVTGLDGKEYRRSETKTPRRRAITDQARDIGWDIRKQAEKVERLFQDDRFSRNKEEMAPHLRSHLEYVIRVCQDSLDHLNK